MTDEMSYSNSHTSTVKGATYDEMYSHGYYRHLWTEIERPLLANALRAVSNDRPAARAVDLACGTGRVTAVGAEYYDSVLGVDISDSMLAAARDNFRHLPNIEFRELDITRTSASSALADFAPADCVTAFRLFTNADAWLRDRAAEFAHGILAEGGTFITNTHMNPVSPVGRIYLIERRVRDLLRRPQRMFNKVLDPHELVEILERAGFRDIQTRPYAAFPGIPKLWKHTPASLVAKAERRFGGRAWNQCVLVEARK